MKNQTSEKMTGKTYNLWIFRYSPVFCIFPQALEYIGKSRSYKFYQSGELIKHREDDREYMGRTLYLGSLKSEVYFCIYEKDYEQYVKLGTPLEEADIINRFEIQKYTSDFSEPR